LIINLIVAKLRCQTNPKIEQLNFNIDSPVLKTKNTIRIY